MSPKPVHRRLVGEQIRSCRKRVGLTQEKLAENAELHHNFIGQVERGNLNVSLDSLVRIARALHVRVRDLVQDV
ncbi:MAG: helix-turn-helix transcriptional regulator [Verrucomicrobia bacterium]|nr:helix-turn-helix transcriptional regulator [Verrucomicrobiota bacterium]